LFPSNTVKLDEEFYIPQQPKRKAELKEVSRSDVKGLEAVATAYTWTGNRTATGTIPVEGITVAVDPKVIPLHSHLEIYLGDYCLGTNFKALDTGGVIKGNKIDIYFDNEDEAWEFGVKKVKVVVKASEYK